MDLLILKMPYPKVIKKNSKITIFLVIDMTGDYDPDDITKMKNNTIIGDDYHDDREE